MSQNAQSPQPDPKPTKQTTAPIPQLHAEELEAVIAPRLAANHSESLLSAHLEAEELEAVIAPRLSVNHNESFLSGRLEAEELEAVIAPRLAVFCGQGLYVASEPWTSDFRPSRVNGRHIIQLEAAQKGEECHVAPPVLLRHGPTNLAGRQSFGLHLKIDFRIDIRGVQ